MPCYNEVRADEQNESRRNSVITANITDPGTKFEKVPDVIGIFISKFDTFKQKKPFIISIALYGKQEMFPRTSMRKHQFIVSEGGKKEMCEIVENYAREVAEQAAKEAAKEAREKNKVVARKLLERGVDFDVVLHSIESITGEELNEIYKDVKNNNI